MMSAYVIAQIQVTDSQQYPNYMKLAAPAVAKYGGKYLARGGKTELLEGDLAAERLVILEFASMEAARRFYNSPEYVEARKARQHAAKVMLALVEGYNP